MGAKLCISAVHAWILFQESCPAKSILWVKPETDGPGKINLTDQKGNMFSAEVGDWAKKGQLVRIDKPIRAELQAEYDRLGCGLGKTVLGGNDSQARILTESRKVQYGGGGAGQGVQVEEMPTSLCFPSFTIPIPDLCSRGIVADIHELYVNQGIRYEVDGTLRLNPYRLSHRCKKTKDEYIRKLTKSGGRNCWGLPIDFKAMYCAFYGGVEAWQDTASSLGSCSTADCCTQSRARARSVLAPFLSGESKGKPNVGVLQKMVNWTEGRLGVKFVT
eukprot:TRINITY_DN54307_c0_g1_i1.p1 TRINITY_DN54307_c0_g1~~TRINITY_DN54307_c0_g1_i1.p1  ORF type:complete len:315 (+),score=34.61 TRINITY_DN54307_c0_g1_i1:122-946(+)